MSREKFRKLLEDAAKARGVPYELLDRVATTESGYNPSAVSSAGAQGMFQIMPGTQRELGVRDPFDPAQSAAGGAEYLKRMYDKFGDWQLATAAYNSGPGRVQKFGADWKRYPRETQGYQQKIWGDGFQIGDQDMTNQELVRKGLALAGEVPKKKVAAAARAIDTQDSKAFAGYRPPKASKLDLAMGAGSGLLGAIATLLGGGGGGGGISPISAGGHGAAPIVGGQSYNAGPLQKQGAMGVSPYQSAIFSLLGRG